MEESLNSQNDRIYAAAFEDIPEQERIVQRFQKPGSVMVWGAVSSRGKFPLVFVESGVKINSAYYREAILEGWLKVEAQRVFGQGQWTFQQDSAPAHRAKIVQDWCRAQIPDFISSSEWPLQPRFESAGLFHMGHFGGKGQCCPAPQRGFAEETSTGRMAKVTDESNS